MAFRWLCRGIAALAVGVVELPAQEPAGPGVRRENLRVFVDCEQCEFDYLRTEMPWVAYVRDRTVADVHILVTEIGTGGGGSEYTINLLGIESFAALSDTIRIVTEPGATDDAVREQLTRAIQLGLVPYVLRTPQGSRLRLTLDDPEDESRVGSSRARAIRGMHGCSRSPLTDRWSGRSSRVSSTRRRRSMRRA